MTSSADPAIGIISRALEAESGIALPSSRHAILSRRLSRVITTLGYGGEQQLAAVINRGKLPTDHQDALVRAITVGETWFHRDSLALEELQLRTLPQLVKKRSRAGEHRMEFWSAACATGPEAYTLAMLATGSVPYPNRWNISVLATDINPDFLGIARKACYSGKSMRMLPKHLLARYFSISEGGFEIKEDLKSLVEFRQLNLRSGPYPRSPSGRGFDVIACSNVLMYFSEEVVREVLSRIAERLAPDGVLLVSAVEAPLATLAGFERVNPEVCQLLRPTGQSSGVKREPGEPGLAASGRGRVRGSTSARPATRAPEGNSAGEESTKRASTVVGAPGGFGPRPTQSPAPVAELSPPATVESGFSALANGEIALAQRFAEQALAESDTDATAHLLLSVILQEEGEHEAAKCALRRALYLEPGFSAAQLELANILAREGDAHGARRRYEAVLKELSDTADDQIVDPIHRMSAVEVRTAVAAALKRRYGHGDIS